MKGELRTALGACLVSGACSSSGWSGFAAAVVGPPAADSGADSPVSASPREPAPTASRFEAYDGGAAVEGVVGPQGGTVSRLYFAVVGDTRPAAMDDTAGYPTAVISKIYGTMNALSPRPSFALATGDYQYTSPSGTEAMAQVGLYAAARAAYVGVLFPAMGNHECTGLTASNCGAGSVDGTPGAYRAYLARLLQPIGQVSPYYEVDVGSSDGSWTSKILVTAANAWTSAQATWLDRALGRKTKYTFVVRHEGSNATTAPGVVPSERILAAHPYTLAICGHTHTYEHPSRREVIVGNGGAPLSSSAKGYGFAMISQQADGSLVVDMVDYASGRADPRFRFALNADGSAP